LGYASLISRTTTTRYVLGMTAKNFISQHSPADVGHPTRYLSASPIRAAGLWSTGLSSFTKKVFRFVARKLSVLHDGKSESPHRGLEIEIIRD
jgi:hypothetical protein